MKKLLTILGFLFLGNVVFAQATNTPSATVKKQIEVLKNADLNLTDVQLGRITTVLMGEEQNSVKVLKAVEGNKSLLEMRLKEIKDHKISNIKGAMSPQQVEKFDALKLADKL
jgi:hypothetical protein